MDRGQIGECLRIYWGWFGLLRLAGSLSRNPAFGASS